MVFSLCPPSHTYLYSCRLLLKKENKQAHMHQAASLASPSCLGRDTQSHRELQPNMMDCNHGHAATSHQLGYVAYRELCRVSPRPAGREEVMSRGTSRGKRNAQKLQ